MLLAPTVGASMVLLNSSALISGSFSALLMTSSFAATGSPASTG